MTDTALHQESGEQSAGARAVGFIDSQMGRFTSSKTLYEGKHAVANCRASGLITFPEDRETDKSKLRRKQVLAINELRAQGVKAYDAAKQVGISYVSFLDWQNKLGIKYEGKSLRGLTS